MEALGNIGKDWEVLGRKKVKKALDGLRQRCFALRLLEGVERRRKPVASQARMGLLLDTAALHAPTSTLTFATVGRFSS